ncbi:MAG: flagellar hook protein, partial [Desulfovibrionaceae bacterium]
MRVSTSQIFSSSLSYINDSLSDLSTLNNMNSTQKRINSPSDDPSGAANVVVLRAEESCLSGYLDACARAYELLSSADTALQSASELIISALETAEQAATETYTDEQLDAMAIEILSNME